MDQRIIDALCATEAFRHVGFTPDEIFTFIYLDGANNGAETIGIKIVKAPEFVYRVCELWCSDEEFRKLWIEGVAIWNDPKNKKENQILFENSEVRKNYVDLLLLLQFKGFDLGELNRRNALSAKKKGMN